MPENNQKNRDLLTKFFDHSPNYKSKRQLSYFNFLKLQMRHNFSNLNNILYMTFILKPSRLLVANLSIFLVVVFSLISFSFGLITQAQSNPGASFIPTDTLDTTRLDDCNLDIIFPKKIQSKDSLISAVKSFSISKEVIDYEGFLFGVDATNNDFVNFTNVACFRNSSMSSRAIVSETLFEPETRFVLKIDDITLLQAKDTFKWTLFNNKDIRNIQIVRAYDVENKINNEFFKEYLLFENKDLKFLIHSDSYVLEPYGIKNTLDQIPKGTDINYNEKNDFIVSRKIQYDVNNQYTEFFNYDQPDNYDKQLKEQNNKRLIQFFGVFLAISIISLTALNYLLDKQLKPKINLQNKLRLLSATFGLIYLVFVNIFNAFTNQVDFLNQVYQFRFDVISIFVIAGVTLIVLITNFNKLSKATKIIDLAFIGVYALYAISVFFNLAPSYGGDGSGDFWNYGLLFVFPAIFTLSWVSYSIWNAYLVISNLIKSKK